MGYTLHDFGLSQLINIREPLKPQPNYLKNISSTQDVDVSERQCCENRSQVPVENIAYPIGRRSPIFKTHEFYGPWVSHCTFRNMNSRNLRISSSFQKVFCFSQNLIELVLIEYKKFLKPSAKPFSILLNFLDRL